MQKGSTNQKKNQVFSCREEGKKKKKAFLLIEMFSSFFMKQTNKKILSIFWIFITQLFTEPQLTEYNKRT